MPAKDPRIDLYISKSADFARPILLHLREIVNIACCLLYTSDAADERSSVDLGGRRIIKKKKNQRHRHYLHV